jgi:hypothetical protein
MSEANSTTEIEIREIPGAIGYRAGDDGSLWSAWGKGRRKPGATWVRLNPWPKQQGHLELKIRLTDGRRRACFAHVLILEAFAGPCPDGMECRHLDGNPTNNRLSNLVWGTRLENMADKDRHGRQNRGETHSSAKITEADVLEIRRLRREGFGPRELSRMFGLSSGNICGIVSGATWKHIPLSPP